MKPFVALGLLSWLLGACASQPQPVAPAEAASVPAVQPKTPTAAKPEATSESQEPTVAPEPANTNAEPSPTPQSEEAPVASPERTFDPVAVLTGRETAFVLDYANSGAKEIITQRCHQAHQQQASPGKEEAADPEEAAAKLQQKFDECLQKERSKFVADVLRFRRSERGDGTLTIYRRTGSSLPEVYVARVAYEQQGRDHVKVVIKASVSGIRPIVRDQQSLDILVPNDYSLEITDSSYGRLPYDAKVGLVAN